MATMRSLARQGKAKKRAVEDSGAARVRVAAEPGDAGRYARSRAVTM